MHAEVSAASSCRGCGSAEYRARYLTPARRRHLTIVTNALVTRLLIERGRAVGAEWRQAVISCRRMPIAKYSCAGSFNSPQTPLLSGVGPADEPKAVGVKPAHDPPGVGRNMSEHLNSGYVQGTDTPVKYLGWSPCRGAVAADSGVRSPSLALGHMFMALAAGACAADLQSYVSITVDTSLLWITAPPVHCYGAGGLLHPQSQGWVKLRPASPGGPRASSSTCLASGLTWRP